MSDLSAYRLNKFNELEIFEKKMGVERYLFYKTKVFMQLDKIQVGETFYFEPYVKIENLELFVKLCCLYIIEHSDCELTDDYTGFRKRN